MPDAASDFYVVIHVWTTCDEHGVCVSKDAAEVIEIAWILINAYTLEEVCTFLSKRFACSVIFSCPSQLILTLLRSVAKKY
jgi:hypothetical protein